MGCLVSRLAFLPPPRHAGASRIRGHSGLCWLTAAGEDVPALHIKCSMFAPGIPRGRELPSAKFTVLASHGNADDLASVIDRYESLAYRMGCDFFAYEYSGYSISSEGSVPSEEACYRNIQAAFDYLVEELQVPPSRIILYGVSLGSGPAVEMARRRPSGLAGMILQSPLTSAIRTQLPDCCVIHGTQDKVVPCSHGQLLHSLVRRPVSPLWVERAGHNDLEYVAETAYYDRLQRFVEEIDAVGGVDVGVVVQQ
jgi:abhydrolase domain-containing protein 17